MTREEAIEIVKSAFSAWESEFRVPNDDWSEEHEALDMAIEALKTDIVRCKDCKHWKWIEWAKEYRCTFRNTAFNTRDNDFCSFGERGEE